jgi:hypothetical protein
MQKIIKANLFEGKKTSGLSIYLILRKLFKCANCTCIIIMIDHSQHRSTTRCRTCLHSVAVTTQNVDPLSDQKHSS